MAHHDDHTSTLTLGGGEQLSEKGVHVRIGQKPQPALRFGDAADLALQKSVARRSFWQNFFGEFRFQSCSWARLAKVAESRQQELVALLQQIVDSNGWNKVQIAGASLAVIHGEKGNRSLRNWWLKIDCLFDHNMTCISGTSPALAHRRPHALPSLEVLGMQKQLDEQDFHDTKVSDGYIFRVSEEYTFRTWHGYPDVAWICELVVLRLEVQPRPVRVLQVLLKDTLDVAEVRARRMRAVALLGLDGKEQTDLEVDVFETVGKQLHCAVALKTGIRLQDLRLVFPNGCCVPGEDDVGEQTLDRFLQIEQTGRSNLLRVQ